MAVLVDGYGARNVLVKAPALSAVSGANSHYAANLNVDDEFSKGSYAVDGSYVLRKFTGQQTIYPNDFANLAFLKTFTMGTNKVAGSANDVCGINGRIQLTQRQRCFLQ